LSATEWTDIGGTPLLPPSVTFQGDRWTTEALADTAAAWHAHLARSLSPTATAVAIVMQSHPQTIALLFAVSALQRPVVLLHPDPATWRSAPPFPPAMPVVLAPIAAHFREPLRAAGLSAVVVPDAPAGTGAPRPRFFATHGFVVFTSGSMGAPKPTFRSTRGMLQAARTISETYGLPAGGRIAGCLALATSFGLTQNIVLPAILGGHLGLLDRFDHRSLLNLFAEERFDYWPGTALMADLLARAPLDQWAGRAPQICNISSGHLPERVYERFLERFGVPLRQSYGRSECSFITSETAPEDHIRPDTVGVPSPGVEIRCGESPDDPVPAGSPGRIWIRCPWHSEGYGYPPDVEPIARPDGWCASEDVGMLTTGGRLVLLGRIDDCFKTTGGFLVSPSLIVGALRGDPAVIDAAVVPIRGRSGTVIGVMVVAHDGTKAADIRALARRALPAWLRPAVVGIRPSIPCLPSGKHDRTACIRLLEAQLANEVHGAFS
jgi:acyl-CoA synthetase (AMP-forming)/AMP-acid ligase II